MNNITVKVELCEADRKRLDDILAALQAAGTPFAAAPAPEAEEPKSEPAQAPEVEGPVWLPGGGEVPVAPVAPAPQTEEAPSVSAEDIRQVLLVLNGAGKGAEAKAIIKEYAEKLSDIPADKLLECLERLNKLGG